MAIGHNLVSFPNGCPVAAAHRRLVALASRPPTPVEELHEDCVVLIRLRGLLPEEVDSQRTGHLEHAGLHTDPEQADHTVKTGGDGMESVRQLR